MRPRKAFTLVELLVVIAVIAVLIAILLPALSKARYQAQVTCCTARLHDFAAALALYANDHRGYFPRGDISVLTGRNTQDVSLGFFRTLRVQYRRPHEMFFCPLADEEQLDEKWAHTWDTDPNGVGGFIMIGYGVWIPRSIAGVMTPPVGANAGFSVYDSDEIIRGPIRMGEKLAVANPILSDVALTNTIHPFPGPNDLTRDRTLKLYRFSGHLRGGTLQSINVAFADGHVQHILGAEVKPRYLGLPTSVDCWNWR